MSAEHSKCVTFLRAGSVLSLCNSVVGRLGVGYGVLWVAHFEFAADEGVQLVVVYTL